MTKKKDNNFEVALLPPSKKLTSSPSSEKLNLSNKANPSKKDFKKMKSESPKEYELGNGKKAVGYNFSASSKNVTINKVHKSIKYSPRLAVDERILLRELAKQNSLKKLRSLPEKQKNIDVKINLEEYKINTNYENSRNARDRLRESLEDLKSINIIIDSKDGIEYSSPVISHKWLKNRSDSTKTRGYHSVVVSFHADYIRNMLQSATNVPYPPMLDNYKYVSQGLYDGNEIGMYIYNQRYIIRGHQSKDEEPKRIVKRKISNVLKECKNIPAVEYEKRKGQLYITRKDYSPKKYKVIPKIKRCKKRKEKIQPRYKGQPRYTENIYNPLIKILDEFVTDNILISYQFENDNGKIISNNELKNIDIDTFCELYLIANTIISDEEEKSIALQNIKYI